MIKAESLVKLFPKTCSRQYLLMMKVKVTFSGTKLRQMFLSGETPPKEFMRPEVSETILKFKDPFVEEEKYAPEQNPLIKN